MDQHLPTFKHLPINTLYHAPSDSPAVLDWFPCLSIYKEHASRLIPVLASRWWNEFL